jgi:colanic acid/amylovoran biosynthesis protein
VKKIYVSAYLNFNFGDDLMVQHLFERYPTTKFIVYAKDYRYRDIFKVYPNVEIKHNIFVDNKYVNYLLNQFPQFDFIFPRRARSFDATVIVGGALFVENKRARKSFIRRSNLITNSPKTFIIGANFGPYESEEFKDKHDELFSRCEDVCFRDEYSFKLFRENPSVREAKDIVFSMSNPVKSIGNKILGISVIDVLRKCSFQESDEFYRKMAEVATYYIQQGYRIHFFSFCKYEGDEDAIQQILTKLDESMIASCEKVFYSTDINEVLLKIKQLDGMISTRFHAIILGLAFGIPTLPIIYQSKSINMLKSIQFDEDFYSLDEFSGVNAKVIFENLAKYRYQCRLVEEALSQFQKLDQFLKE